MKESMIPLQQFNKDSSVVFFSGAGISAESGISTFRDPDGYWAKYDPMTLASPEGFRNDPELVLRWYAARRKAVLQAQPNPGHLVITEFQKLFKKSVVITQNIDGLHALAGNDPVMELHGNIHRHKCIECGEAKLLPEHLEKKINYCVCGGLIRPDVVWFGESLPVRILEEAFLAVQSCDILFTIGTSNQTYPAGQLPFEAQRSGAYVIEINPEETPFSPQADISLRALSGTALPKIYEELKLGIS